MIKNSSVKKIGLFSATSLVVANIIGTGIFTTTGFLAVDLKSYFALIFIWIVGGLLALSGALSYGELAAEMPRSGGEYHFLRRIYHPALGFVAGFVSLTAGFAAPIAASAKAFGRYASSVSPFFDPTISAAILVIIVTSLHSVHIQASTRFQNIFTVLKVILIITFICFGFSSIYSSENNISFLPTMQSDFDSIFSSSFAIGLVYVSFSYSGWNASSYIINEIKNPEKNVPRSLFLGTLIVTILYLLLNIVFLTVAPISEISGQEAVGDIAAKHIFGEKGALIMSGMISIGLISSVSSMIITGPRVASTMGEDISFFKIFARKNQKGIPVVALILQAMLALVIIFIAKLEQIISYIGFTLNLFAFLTVAGLYINRISLKTKPVNPSVGYPITPALFLCISGWMTYHSVFQKPIESLFGAITLIIGATLYVLWARHNIDRQT